ncbi:MAG: hypothetical protein JWM57_3659 [Phycisphaerales bacterium]|nr:hypothetical protein [Phycisphaerales bacterium]
MPIFPPFLIRPAILLAMAVELSMSLTSASGATQPSATQPTPRADANSTLAHQQLIEKAKAGVIDVYFLGDSITRRWGCSDPQWADLLANWNHNFFGWNAGNFGWGADRIENVLWRIENGELAGVNPKVIVILAGTNNVGDRPGDDAKVANIAAGLQALVDSCHRLAPNSKIILTGIFPRNDNPAVVPEIRRINAEAAKIADGNNTLWVDISDQLADKNGMLFDGMTLDKLHLSGKGYQVWADALRPLLTSLLGPPAKADHAPPPTGDPSAKAPSRGS